MNNYTRLPWEKAKENKNLGKRLKLTRKLENRWNMKMMVVPIVIRVLGWIPKSLGKRLEPLGKIETVHDTIKARIFKRSKENWKELLSLGLQWRPPASTGMKIRTKWNYNTHTHTHTHIYIYIYKTNKSDQTNGNRAFSHFLIIFNYFLS